MHTIRILRDYLGMSQAALAKQAGITQADLSEMEHKQPYGKITKYKRLADTLNTSVHSILMNDPCSIPISFLETAAPPEYTNAIKTDNTIIGRAGEEKAFRIEQNRLMDISPTLSGLVLPYYKMKVPSPGFDILSYENDGTPIYIEVKTTEKENANNFQLTKHEYDIALSLSNTGRKYRIYFFTAWGSGNEKLNVIDFKELISEKRVHPVKYLCNMREKEPVISGLIYHRKILDISQAELSARTGIPAATLCKYELGTNVISAEACVKLAKFFHVSVDDLLKQYSTDL